MKHLFIVNPVAGGRDRTGEVASRVEQAFSGDRAGTYEIYTTTAPMDAARKIETEAASGEELRVYACGGDGTLNECVCGAVHRDNVAVTHYPCGTGNDFVRTFGAERDRFGNLDALLEGEVRRLDAIDCNGRCSINICSVGIDARIAIDVHKYSALPLIGGSAGYVTSAAVNLFKGIKQSLRVSCGSVSFSGDQTLICACNGSYYGGGFHPVPEARPDDGLLDFLIVKGISRLRFIRLIGGYAKGRYAEMSEYITHLRGERIEIEGDETLSINLDGEAMFGRKVCMQLLPRAVNFIVPKNMAYFRTASAEA